MPNISWKNKIKRKGLGVAPQEASSNLQTLDTRDNRFTGRTKQLGLRVKPEFLKRLKELALEEDCFIVEVLEKAFAEYEKKHRKEHFSLKKNKVPQKQLNQFWKVNFDCDKCYRRFERSIVFSLASDLDESSDYPTYCAGCKGIVEREINNG